MIPMKKTKTIDELPIDSTILCCNFVNTVYSWKTHNPYDFLEDYQHFIDWCHKLLVAESDYLNHLQTLAKRNPADAHSVLEELRSIREKVHGFISVMAKEEMAKIPKLLKSINPLFTEMWKNLSLDFNGTVFTASYNIKPFNLKTPVWIIIKSFYDLLTQMEITRVKECPSCGWVFYDETKNGKRKWCNPLNCGTQDKMSRYHQRLRGLKD
jgi:predicted RNA-binding Zn ribbon-like protein